MTERFTVSLSEEAYESLEQKRERLGLSRSAYVEMSVRESARGRGKPPRPIVRFNNWARKWLLPLGIGLSVGGMASALVQSNAGAGGLSTLVSVLLMIAAVSLSYAHLSPLNSNLYAFGGERQ